MAEALNLPPLLPGTNSVDQVAKICAVLGALLMNMALILQGSR